MILGIIIAIAFLGACFCAAVFGISKRQDEQKQDIAAMTEALCYHRHVKLPDTIDCATCGCMVKKELAVAGPDRIEVKKSYRHVCPEIENAINGQRNEKIVVMSAFGAHRLQ